jgi:hypothetical protein
MVNVGVYGGSMGDLLASVVCQCSFSDVCYIANTRYASIRVDNM